MTEVSVALRLNEDQCSSCSICASLCPFEALKRDPETGKTTLEIEKCQVCGICYSACPAGAISIDYYDVASLISYLEKSKKEYDSDVLVMMCKGSAPDFSLAAELFGVSKFIPLSVPCVGRIPAEIFPKVLTMGIKKIYVLACEEDSCRFKRGSPITGRRISVVNLLLEYLGYGKEVISLKWNTPKVKADREKCIKCGNCVFYCPYEAVKLESPEAARFDLDACRGCGLCVAMCPAMALELEGWENGRISASISKLASEMKKPKILVFRCQWAVFQSPEELDGNVGIIDLPCAGRVEALHILEAFEKGIDGVLVAACPEEECKLERGSREAQRQVNALKERLSQIGLGEKLHFCTVAPRNPQDFENELKQFREKIKGEHK
jgi:2-oxoacid:acceptor oxidoreductase delta subunit (pyruvate/2-ketoisovalerate family)